MSSGQFPIAVPRSLAAVPFAPSLLHHREPQLCNANRTARARLSSFLSVRSRSLVERARYRPSVRRSRAPRGRKLPAAETHRRKSQFISVPAPIDPRAALPIDRSRSSDTIEFLRYKYTDVLFLVFFFSYYFLMSAS